MNTEQPSSLQDQAVLVLGLGQSGLAMARWCSQRGARVWVMDTRSEPPGLADLRTHAPQAQFIAGEFDATVLTTQGIRAVFKSPGLSPAEVASVWRAAVDAGLWVGTELSLFVHALREAQDQTGYAPQVLAITGTNGKTTVTALTTRLLQAAGKDVAMAGNIGPNLLDTWRERQAGVGLPAVWVLELSSFQLDGVEGFEPTASTVLNLSEDHLDWHGDMAAYCAAKARIAGSTGLLVLNRSDARVMALQPVNDVAKKKKTIEREVATFGSDAPRMGGDWGLENVNGMHWLVRLIEREGGRKKARAGAPEHEGYDDDAPFMQRLMPAEALRIHGQHNALNALAALALASHTQATLGPMLYALREYRGEPHRASTVAVVQDVEYINDSKGTNVGATVAALQGLGQDRRLVLIAGGEGKGQDFSPLAAVVARHTRAVVLIGRDAALLRQALQGGGVPLIEAASMLDAVQRAAEQAQAGDAVLLSPACASFDMFDHYVQRGEAFAQAVQALAEDAGQVWEGAA